MFRIEALLPHSLPPFLDFWHQLASFDSTFICLFGKLLRLGFLECPEVPLVHQQASLPISKSGVSLVSLKVIALVAYLGDWKLVTLIVELKILQDDYPFLLGVIRANSSGPLPFQVHLRSTCDLLPPTI